MGRKDFRVGCTRRSANPCARFMRENLTTQKHFAQHPRRPDGQGCTQSYLRSPGAIPSNPLLPLATDRYSSARRMAYQVSMAAQVRAASPRQCNASAAARISLTALLSGSLKQSMQHVYVERVVTVPRAPASTVDAARAKYARRAAARDPSPGIPLLHGLARIPYQAERTPKRRTRFIPHPPCNHAERSQVIKSMDRRHLAKFPGRRKIVSRAAVGA